MGTQDFLEHTGRIFKGGSSDFFDCLPFEGLSNVMIYCGNMPDDWSRISNERYGFYKSIRQENSMTNNIIFRKMKIALTLDADETLEILALADMRLSKHKAKLKKDVEHSFAAN